MVNNISIVGGADGPASIFLAGKLGVDWINGFGLIWIVLLLLPNIIYAIRVKHQQNRCTNKIMNLLEQAGRYGCMFLMVFNIGIAEFGFYSIGAFLLYVFGNAILIIAYWIIWMLYFQRQSDWKQIALAVIPVCLFLLSGITMHHYLLILFSVIFGIGHIYVTGKNKSSKA